MLLFLAAAVAFLAWAVWDQSKAVKALRQQVADQQKWIQGISSEVHSLPETMRNSEAMRQFLDLLRNSSGAKPADPG